MLTPLKNLTVAIFNGFVAVMALFAKAVGAGMSEPCDNRANDHAGFFNTRTLNWDDGTDIAGDYPESGE